MFSLFVFLCNWQILWDVRRKRKKGSRCNIYGATNVWCLSFINRINQRMSIIYFSINRTADCFRVQLISKASLHKHAHSHTRKRLCPSVRHWRQRGFRSPRSSVLWENPTLQKSVYMSESLEAWQKIGMNSCGEKTLAVFRTWTYDFGTLDGTIRTHCENWRRRTWQETTWFTWTAIIRLLLTERHTPADGGCLATSRPSVFDL